MNVTVSKWLFEFTSQAAHFFAAFAVMQTVRLHSSHRASLIVAGSGFIAAAAKEFWYDYRYESADERGSSFLDFAMYAAGICAGMLA
jgi:hypothetical protein